MMKFESDLDAPVRVVPTGTPDMLDAWYDQQDPFEGDEDPFYDEEGPYLPDDEGGYGEFVFGFVEYPAEPPF